MTCDPLRFAFDLGTNSIGWVVFRLDHEPADNTTSATVTELLGCGVRLFDDGRNPKDGSSLAEMRRVPRSARRRRDRFLDRRANLIALLVELQLMPANAEERRKLVDLDPYALRARGLDHSLSHFELGRALFHLNQRRGFKSNRRADRKADGKEKGKISDAAGKLREALDADGARTFGEFLWRRHGGPQGNATPRTRRAVRIRLEGEGSKALYEYYPLREMLETEFDTLLAKQRQYHPEILTDAAIDQIQRAIFWQRPLKPVEPGRCTLVPSEPRLAKALPSVEERTIYETLNHLRYGEGVTRDKVLTMEQRDLVAAALIQGTKGQKVSFKTLRSALKLGSSVRFSLEDSGKEGLDDFSARSAKAIAHKDLFGPRWHGLPLDERDAIVQRLIGSEDEERIQAWLVKSFNLKADAALAVAKWRISEPEAALSHQNRFDERWSSFQQETRAAIVRRLTGAEDENEIVAWLSLDYGLEEENARKVAKWSPREGVARLGKSATKAVLAELKADVIQYSEAVRRAGEKLGLEWHHSDFRDGVIDLPLPYYGRILERQVSFGSGNPEDADEKRYGRVANPTVHIGLGQLRRIVNKLIVAYGEPSQIVVELARDLKLTKEQKDKQKSENKKNQDANEQRRKELEKLGQEDTGENRLKLRLFEEQQRANDGIALCPYSLKQIPIASLFSDDVEIDHILPYSRTLDDTRANRIVCYRAANREKRQKSPYEAFGHQANWNEIVAAAKNLPANKRWRFAPDAMERFESKERNFLARQINETRYLSRLARLYLGAATGSTDQVYVTTGQLTAMLRARWGLNSILGDENRKVRADHRHHAVDAITIGAIDRSLLQEMARRAGQAEEEGRTRITADVPEPFPGFRDAAFKQVRAITVSIKPEHGKGGALHEDTAYGLVKDKSEADEIGNLVFRKPLVDLNANEIDSVRDPHLRRKLQDLAAPFRNEKGKLIDEKRLKAALEGFSIPETLKNGTMLARQVRRVRIGKAKGGEVHIRDPRTGAVYKALLPGENHHIDIVQMRDGTWQGFAATVFDVNQKDWRPRWEREKLGGKLVMRIHKGDMIEVESKERPGERVIMTVHRLSPSNNVLYLASHNEGGELSKRHDDKDDLFRWDFANIGGLKGRKARKVAINELGTHKFSKSNC